MSSSDQLPVIWRGNTSTEEYERARVARVFNHRRPARYPVAIVEATEEAHIVEAIKLAKSVGARVSVRSGGHSWAAWSVRDNAVLIDLGRYKHIDLDEKTGLVAVSPSTTGRMLNAVLEKNGFLFPGGHCPDVGLGGFLLQGGMGWVCRSWGWACQYVKAIDVVTAEGHKLRCDENENKDLFWAARGAGPGFPALITRFHLQPRPLPTHMRVSGYVYPKSSYKLVQNWIISTVSSADEDTEIVCLGMHLPEYEESVIMASFTTFKNSDEAARRALQPIEDSIPGGHIQKWFARPTSLPEEYVNQGLANPQGHRYCSENAYVNNEVDVASTLEEAFTTLPSRKSFALWYAMAPVSQRPLPDMALSMQSDHYFALYTVWENEIDDDRCQSWVRDVMSKVAPNGIGQYLGDSDMQVRDTKYWADEQHSKLMDIRRQWDPKGIFCGYLDKGDQSGMHGLENKL